MGTRVLYSQTEVDQRIRGAVARVMLAAGIEQVEIPRDILLLRDDFADIEIEDTVEGTTKIRVTRR